MSDDNQVVVENPLQRIYNAIAFILVVSFLVALLFLFWGEPDVFDVLRESILANASTKN